MCLGTCSIRTRFPLDQKCQKLTKISKSVFGSIFRVTLQKPLISFSTETINFPPKFQQKVVFLQKPKKWFFYRKSYFHLPMLNVTDQIFFGQNFLTKIYFLSIDLKFSHHMRFLTLINTLFLFASI